MKDLKYEDLERIIEDLESKWSDVKLYVTEDVEEAVVIFRVENTKTGYNLVTKVQFQVFTDIKLPQEVFVRSTFTKMIQKVGGRLK